MKFQAALVVLCSIPLLPSLNAADIGNAFYGDAPDENHPWAIHDRNRPQPPIVKPGTFSSQEQPGTPPSDAIILFSGKESDIANWESDQNPAQPTKWIVKDQALQCVPGAGYIRSKEQFGDCQLHVEWTAPTDISGSGQGRGNSGIFLMGVEVQVLDSYNNPTYADGMAGSIYGINPPLVNPIRPPGQWQSYDIVFRRPIWKDGKEVDRGYYTVFINGVLAQDHTPLEGGGGHMGRSRPKHFPAKGPLKFQDHGNPVRFRNIWVRQLPPRAIEGGTDGFLSAEAAMAERKKIATTIREDAAKLEGAAKTMRLLESVVYENEAGALKESRELLAKFVADVTAAPDKASSKDAAIKYQNALNYLARFKILDPADKTKVELDALVEASGWGKKK